MRLLLVVSRYPWPADRGDKVRTVQFLDFLAEEHEVTLLAPEAPPGAPTPESLGFRLETYRVSPWSGLRGLGRSFRRNLPWQAGLFYQPHLGARLRSLAEQADLVLLQLVRLAAHLEDVGDRPVAVDLIDSLALNFHRRAELESLARKPFFRHEARRLSRCEAKLLARARRTWVVSHRDRQAMAAYLSAVDLERLEVLPLAFPLAQPRAGMEAEAPSPRSPGQGRAPILALTGNLGYFPNVDGFCWWLEEVWPRLRARREELTVVLAGARPARRLRQVAEAAGEGVELVDSPEDLKAVLRRATLAMAPMRCGSGQPLKILEAWECGVSVVASPWAAAGVAPGSEAALRVAATPEEWVRAVEALLTNESLRSGLAAAGIQRLAQGYGRLFLQRTLLAGIDAAAA